MPWLGLFAGRLFRLVYN